MNEAAPLILDVPVDEIMAKVAGEVVLPWVRTLADDTHPHGILKTDSISQTMGASLPECHQSTPAAGICGRPCYHGQARSRSRSSS